MASTISDKAAPMASAPLRYTPDGAVDWGNMWESFCALPRDGGPPHRPTLLQPETTPDPSQPDYQVAVAEIVRGVRAVSGLQATAGAPGWVAIECGSAAMARWLSEAVGEENVAARCDGTRLLVPVGAGYTLKGEIKNVITAVAKTTHYWHDHLPAEVKRAMAAQEQLGQLWRTLQGFIRPGRRA